MNIDYFSLFPRLATRPQVTSMTARSGLAWVRSEAELLRSLPDLNVFFETRRKQRNSPVPLRGVWVGCGDGSDDPSLGPLGASLASVQLFGQWSLIWIEQAEVNRIVLLDLLIANAGVNEPIRGRFRPVYQARDEETEREHLALRKRFPGLVGEPLFQEPWSGRLGVPSDELELESAM